MRTLAKTSIPPVFKAIVNGEHSFLKAHPFLSAKLAFDVLLQSHKAGRAVFDLDANLFAIAHLYNAGRKSNLILSVWKDMELLIHFHGEQNIFVGKAPSDSGAYIRRLLLSRGQSVQKYAKNARSNLATTNTRARRKMREVMLVHDIDHGMNKDCLSKSPRDVQVEVDGMIKRARGRNKMDGNPTMRQDLEDLKLQAVEEEAHLHFNYLHFFCFTAPLLSQVLKALGPDPTGEFWDDATDWTELAISVLQVHDHVRRGLKNEYGIAYADHSRYTSALKTVSGVLEKRIREGGNQLSNRMEEGVEHWQRLKLVGLEPIEVEATGAAQEDCATPKTEDLPTISAHGSPRAPAAEKKAQDESLQQAAMAEAFLPAAKDLERLTIPWSSRDALHNVGKYIERYVEEKGDMTGLDLRMWDYVAGLPGLPQAMFPQQTAPYLRALFQDVAGQEARARVARSLDNLGHVKKQQKEKTVSKPFAKPDGQENVDPASGSSILRDGAAAALAKMENGSNGCQDKSFTISEEMKREAQAFFSDAPSAAVNGSLAPPLASPERGRGLGTMAVIDFRCFHELSAASVDKLPKPAPPTTDTGLSLPEASLMLSANVGGGKSESPGALQDTAVPSSHESHEPSHLVMDIAMLEAESIRGDTAIATIDQPAQGISAVAIANPPSDSEQMLKFVVPVVACSKPATDAPFSTTPSDLPGSSTPVSQFVTPPSQSSRPWSRFEILRHQAQMNREMQAAKPAMCMSLVVRRRMFDAKRQREKEEKAKAEEVEARRAMIKAQRQALEKRTTDPSVVRPINQDQKSAENWLDTYFEARQEDWIETSLMQDGEEVTVESSEARSATPTATETTMEASEPRAATTTAIDAHNALQANQASMPSAKNAVREAHDADIGRENDGSAKSPEILSETQEPVEREEVKIYPDTLDETDPLYEYFQAVDDGNACIVS